MSKVIERYHNLRLNNKNINIRTFYKDGNNVLEKNTNGSKDDSINKGIRLRKEYYYKDKLLSNISDFDSRMIYNFVKSKNDNGEIKCINCGYIDKEANFNYGCPYCKSYYNLEYDNKDMGKFTYDTLSKNNTYRIIIFIIIFILSICFMLFVIHNSSRTFNSFDIFKGFIYGCILGIILYSIFHYIDSKRVIKVIKELREIENQKQIAFWDDLSKMGIDKNKFYNNFNFELQKYFYNDELNKDVIDYDILDYLSFNYNIKDDKIYVNVKVQIRVVYYDDKFSYKLMEKEFNLVKANDKTLDLDGGSNMIRCYNCGASIDALKDKCSYCDTDINYLQEWYLINDKEI